MPEWNFKNFPIKTVGQEAFYGYYILFHYFKIRRKFENNLIVKTSMSSDMDPGDTESNWQKWLKITQMI